MHNPDLTKDGYVRAEHLRRGAIDQRGWQHLDDWHIVRLTLRRKRPELWEVEHRIIRPKGSQPAVNSELFNTLPEARQRMKALRKEPPTSYPSPEEA